jgi:hypothetical protein
MVDHKAIINQQLTYLIGNVADAGASGLVLEVLALQISHIRDRLEEAIPDTQSTTLKKSIPVMMIGDKLEALCQSAKLDADADMVQLNLF